VPIVDSMGKAELIKVLKAEPPKYSEDFFDYVLS